MNMSIKGESSAWIKAVYEDFLMIELKKQKRKYRIFDNVLYVWAGIKGWNRVRSECLTIKKFVVDRKSYEWIGAKNSLHQE